MWHLFKVNNKVNVFDINFYDILHLFFSVSTGDLEQVNIYWVTVTLGNWPCAIHEYYCHQFLVNHASFYIEKRKRLVSLTLLVLFQLKEKGINKFYLLSNKKCKTVTEKISQTVCREKLSIRLKRLLQFFTRLLPV